ncbi:MAG: hypothetical protein ACRCYS_04075, partial [Beijerinckiaceae bacterium]
MSDRIIDAYLGATSDPESTGDPLADEIRKNMLGRATSGMFTSVSPDEAAQANALAKKSGLPPETVQRNLPQVRRDMQIRDASGVMRTYPAVARWATDPRNAAIATDDIRQLARNEKHWAELGRIQTEHQALMKGNFFERNFPGFFMRGNDWETLNSARITIGIQRRAAENRKAAQSANGLLGRAGALFRRGVGGVESGLFQVGGALNEWSGDKEAARQLRLRSAAEQSIGDIRGATRWSDVKKAPSIGNVLAFGAEAGIESLPGMAAAVFALPAYVTSQSGNIGQQRARNNGGQDASLSDVAKASPAALLSAALERFGFGRIVTATGKNVAVRVGKAAAAESLTEMGQGLVEYGGGSLLTDKGFDVGDALDQMIQGAVAGGVMGGALRTAGEASRPFVRTVQEAVAARQASVDAAFLEQAALGALDSKVRKRDPSAFAQFLEMQSQGTPLEKLYIPAETVASYMQDGGFDWDDPDNPFAFDPSLRGQVEQGLAVGGDVVFNTSDYVAHLSGTPAWSAFSEQLRASPDGMSLAEARTYESEYADLMEQRAQDVARAEQDRVANMEPTSRVYDDVFSQARAAGFNVRASQAYAETWAARYESRAARNPNLGNAWEAYKQSGVTIRQELPASVDAYRKADNFDVLINAMRRGKGAKDTRESLLEFISRKGGLDDSGGELSAMDAGLWHRGKPGRKKLIRRSSSAVSADKAQGAMLGGASGYNENTLEAMFDAA